MKTTKKMTKKMTKLKWDDSEWKDVMRHALLPRHKGGAVRWDHGYSPTSASRRERSAKIADFLQGGQLCLPEGRRRPNPVRIPDPVMRWANEALGIRVEKGGFGRGHSSRVWASVDAVEELDAEIVHERKPWGSVTRKGRATRYPSAEEIDRDDLLGVADRHDVVARTMPDDCPRCIETYDPKGTDADNLEAFINLAIALERELAEHAPVPSPVLSAMRRELDQPVLPALLPERDLTDLYMAVCEIRDLMKGGAGVVEKPEEPKEPFRVGSFPLPKADMTRRTAPKPPLPRILLVGLLPRQKTILSEKWAGKAVLLNSWHPESGSAGGIPKCDHVIVTTKFISHSKSIKVKKLADAIGAQTHFTAGAVSSMDELIAKAVNPSPSLPCRS